MISTILICVILLIELFNTSIANSNNLNVFYLESGDEHIFTPKKSRPYGFHINEINIYCYAGSDKTLWKFYQTVQLQIDIENDDYVKYEGSTPEIVKAHYEEHISIFSFNFLTFKKTNIKLNPFNQTCIGIDTLQPYKIRLNVVRADVSKICYLIIGVIIFTFAANLSKNNIFYYLCGISLGICASFLILVFLAGKLFPKRPMMYGVLIGGWTIGYYIIKLLMDNIQLILMNYYSYVIWYILITGFISFIICYRMGPPTNTRSKNLIKWCLQFAALILIYFSSEIEEGRILAIILINLQHYFPWNNCRKILSRICYRWFPPTRRLLTMDEYDEEGIRETKKALDQLRKYCSSPECKQWTMMTRLKNPKRFASFVEGESHLMDEEIFDHDESKVDDSDLSDDNDDENNDDNNDNEEISEDEINNYQIVNRQQQNLSYPNGNRTRPIEKRSITSTRYTLNHQTNNARNVLYRSYEKEYRDDDRL